MLVWLGAWDWDGPAKLQAALALEQQGDSAAALEALDRLAVREKGWEMPHLEAARLRLKLGSGLEEAERLLTHALAVAPTNPRAHYLKGLLEAERGNTAAAIQALEQAVQLREDFPDARYRLASLCADSGDWLRAEHHFRVLSSHRPDWLPVRLGLARALEMQGRLEDAEVELRRLLREQPENTVARRRLADLYERTGRPALAERVLQGHAAPGRRMRQLRPSSR